MKKSWIKITAGVMAGTLLLLDVPLYQNGSRRVQAEESSDVVEGIEIDKLFEDAAVKTYMKENVDLNEDGKLSTAEIGAVRGLDLSGLGIESMKGIENFANLEILQCSDNKIAKLDLSENKELTKLYCNKNKLINLNVNNNSKLQILDCSDNMLGQLEIENCGNLQELYCRNNLIAKLNTAYASNLAILDCGGNKSLKELNTDSNSALKEVRCDGSIITSLNFQDNLNLEKLNCEDNRLQSIDLSANNILKELDCSGNQLKVLDLSNIERLQQVDCSNNQIEEINVKKNTGLISLDCRNNKIQTLDIGSNTMLSSLLCSNNELLCLDIGNNRNITTFICENNERTIDSPVIELKEVAGCEETKISELVNATIEDGMIRFVNTSLPVTYKYQVAENNTVSFTLMTTGTFKSMATVNVEKIADQIYCGKEIKPEMKVVYGSSLLEEGKDYTITYTNNTDAGTATVIMQGKREFDGTIKESFKINPADISETVIAEIPDQVYSGQAVTPNLNLTFEGEELVYGRDYNVNYSDNYNIGKATVEIIGKGNFKGTITRNFVIEAKHIGRAAMKPIKNQVYNGMEICPEVVIEDGSTQLTEGQDYTYIYQDNINAGTAKILISGQGNYGKQSEETFVIEPKAMNTVKVEEIPDVDYNGFEQKPSISVYDTELDTALIENDDYVVKYEDNINAGNATVMIYGIGNYKGQIEKHFTIRVRDSALVEIETIAPQVYTAREIKPDIIIKDGNYRLIEGTDYIIAHTGNKDVGTAKVELIFQGNYQGIMKTQFEIIPRDVAYVDVSKIPDQYYAGKAVMPEFTMHHDSTILVENEDYQVAYEENVEVGIGKINITGIGNYAGSKTIEFSIVPRPIDKTDMFCNDVFTYSGKANEPKPTVLLNEVELQEGIDYEISYLDNICAGIGRIEVRGIGNFCDKAQIEFKILPKELKDITIAQIQEQVYSHAEIKPDIEAIDGVTKLVNDLDYSLDYDNNIDAGNASVTVTGKGNYTGEVKIPFKIQPKNIAETIIGAIKQESYTGVGLKPEITVKDTGNVLIIGKDYKVSYSNNKSAGIALVEVTGRGNYTGSQKAKFVITKANMKNATVIMEESVTYTGKDIKPKMKVYFGKKKLRSGKDYTLVYKRNKAVGKATVIIQGKGNFKSKKTVLFDIGVESPKITGIFAKNNRIITEWSQCTEAEGYEIQYSTDKTFQKKVKKKELKSTKLSFQSGKLKKGSKYYVRMRSYTKVSGKKVYGGYSAVKTVKIK